METVTLTARLATAENFAPYGTLVDVGNDATGDALRLDGGVPRLWIMTVAPLGMEFDRITRHARVTQALASADGRSWYLGVAEPPTDPATDLDAVTVFRIPPGAAVVLARGTWHAGPHVEGVPGRFLNLELSTTNDTDHETVTLPQRLRIDPEASGATPRVTGRRVLIVANRTATSPELLAAVRRLAAAGVGEFRVVVPATVAVSGLQSMAAAWDPFAGLPPLSADVVPSQIEDAQRAASEQLERLLAELRALGVRAGGIVGAPDPLQAVAKALTAEPADEILLSTLPAGLSRWLSRDLPSRCAKRFGLPVTHVEAQAPK